MTIGSKKGFFITLEGSDGSGKTEAMKFVIQYFQNRHCDIVTTREPGGTEIAEAIRKTLFAKYEKEKMVPDTELLLMFASRAQHIANLIRPSIVAGKIVISDRFTDSSFAYQGAGEGISAHRIAILEEWVQQGLQPDLTILLDVPVEIGMQRMKLRSEGNRLDDETRDFYERIRQAYLRRAKQFPDRYHVVDASCDLIQVQQQLSAVLDTVGKW